MSTAERRIPSGIIAATSLIALALAAIIGVPSAFSLLHHSWTQVYAAFAHGYLVLALAIWLGARIWRRNAPQSLLPFWPAAIPTLALGALISALDNLGLGATRLVLLPSLFLCAAWWVLGRDAAKALLIPAVLLHFALPPWALLDRPLQWLTTTTVNFAVDATSIPAYVEGNYFHLPSGSFEIALGCSGLNYLITALALFFFHGAAYLEKWRDRVRVLVIAGSFAIFANWLRVYLLIAVGHWSDMEHYLIRVEHHYFGWALFALLLWPLLNWAVSLEHRDEAALPYRRTATNPGIGTFVALSAAVISLIGLRTLTPPPSETPTGLAALPDFIGAWKADGTTKTEWRPEFRGASISMRRYRLGDSNPVIVLRVAFERQSADARLDAPQNTVVGANGVLDAERAEPLVTNDGTLDAVFREIRVDGRRMMLWTVKSVGGIPYRTRLGGLHAEISLRKANRKAVLAAVAEECVSDCLQVQKHLRQAAATLLPPLMTLDEIS